MAIVSKITCAVVCLAAFNAYAVPYVFESNTKAVASQVNANFKTVEDASKDNFFDLVDLKDLFSTLNMRIALLENSPPTPHCATSDVNRIVIDYTKKIGVLGKTFTIGQSKFTLIKAPFVDIGNGNKYAITFPLPNQSNKGLTTKWVDTSNYCWNTTIAGYPARSAALTFTRESGFSTSVYWGRTSVRLTQTIEILVGNTVVEFTVFGLAHELASDQLVQVPWDYAESKAYLAMTLHQDLINALDDMIDYIDIVKVP